jgi:hypothetical protein
MKTKISLGIILVLLSHICPQTLHNTKRSFSFVVLGDRTGGAVQEIFEQFIVKIKELNPDFIISVGDLIEGYTKSEATINQEWDSIFMNLKELKEKFYFTPGNHDIWDSLSYEIYLKRTGLKKSYYNFSFHRAHFIVLDNSRVEEPNNYDPDQIRWLTQVLKSYKKKDLIFCFMHRPFWKDGYLNQTPDTLHKLFVKFGVDYVFSGHDHFYTYLLWDGVRYFQVGPSGSRFKKYRKEEFGAFQNIVRVTVKDSDVKVEVLTADGRELPYDYIILNDINELDKIEKSVKISPFSFKSQESLSVLVNNISSAFVMADFSWENHNPFFKIEPSIGIISLNESLTEVKFYCKLLSESLYPLPKFILNYPYHGHQKSYKVERLLPVKLTHQAIKLVSPISIDGKLDETVYKKYQPIKIFGSSDGSKSQTDNWRVWLMYDKENFYLSCQMDEKELQKISAQITERDEKVYNDDHINFILQPEVGSDTYYQFFINSKGTVLDRRCIMLNSDSKKDAQWNAQILAQGQINNSGWSLEVKLLLKDLEIKEMPLKEWGFNLVRFQKSKNLVSIYSVPFEHNPQTFAILKFSKE